MNDKTKADILYESLANFTDEEGAIECGAKMRDYARELERENKTLRAQVALDHRAKGLMLLESRRQIDCILFVYSRDREIKSLSADEARDNQKQMFADGWKHTSTIHPARWIEALINHPEGLDAESTRLMDELQFGVSALPNV